MISEKAWRCWMILGLAALLLIVLAGAEAGAGRSFDRVTRSSHFGEPPLYIYKSFAEATGDRG